MPKKILTAKEALSKSGINVEYLEEQAKRINNYLSFPEKGEEGIDLTLRDREVSSEQAYRLIKLIQTDIQDSDIKKRLYEYKKSYSGSEDSTIDFVRNHLDPKEEGYARIFLHIPEGRNQIPKNSRAPKVEEKDACPYTTISAFIQAIELFHESAKTLWYINEKSDNPTSIQNAMKIFNRDYALPWAKGARICLEGRFCPSRGQCFHSQKFQKASNF